MKREEKSILEGEDELEVVGFGEEGKEESDREDVVDITKWFYLREIKMILM